MMSLNHYNNKKAYKPSFLFVNMKNKKNMLKSLMLGVPFVISSCANINSLNIFEKYQPKYNTISHEIISKEENFSNPYLNHKTIDKIIDSSKTYVPEKGDFSKKEKQQIIKRTNEEIKEENKITHSKKFRKNLITLGVLDYHNIPAAMDEDYKITLNEKNDDKTFASFWQRTASQELYKNPSGKCIPYIADKAIKKDSSFKKPIWIKTLWNNYHNNPKETLNQLEKLEEKNNSPIAYEYKEDKSYKLEETDKSRFYFIKGLAYKKLDSNKKAVSNFEKAYKISEKPRIKREVREIEYSSEKPFLIF